MPKVIYEKFKSLDVFYIESVPLNLKDHFVIFREDNEPYGIINDEKITIGEYVEKWQKVIVEIEKWLLKNSDKKIELNFWK